MIFHQIIYIVLLFGGKNLVFCQPVDDVRTSTTKNSYLLPVQRWYKTLCEKCLDHACYRPSGFIKILFCLKIKILVKICSYIAPIICLRSDELVLNNVCTCRQQPHGSISNTSCTPHYVIDGEPCSKVLSLSMGFFTGLFTGLVIYVLSTLVRNILFDIFKIRYALAVMNLEFLD